MRFWIAVFAVLAVSTLPLAGARGAEIKVLTAGAMKGVLVALQPEFERASGDRVMLANDTVGALARRIAEGEACDVAVVSPAALKDLAGKGKVAADTTVPVARVAIGVAVKAGAPKPEIGSVEAFKEALRKAKSVAYIDPASGGSSGIYLAQLWEKLGIADEIRPKAKLKQGGYVADLVASGEAELGVHQISEILPVAGVTLVGPIPEAVQNYTDYAAAVCSAASDRPGAERFLRAMTAADAKRVIEAKGLVPAP